MTTYKKLPSGILIPVDLKKDNYVDHDLARKVELLHAALVLGERAKPFKDAMVDLKLTSTKKFNQPVCKSSNPLYVGDPASIDGYADYMGSPL